MSNNSGNGMVKLGGLWLGKTKGGRSYMSGTLGATARLLVFKNEHKTNDSHPDYVLFLAPRQQEAQAQQAQPELDEDIPF